MCEAVEKYAQNVAERYAQQVAAKEREKVAKEREKTAKEREESIIKMFQDGLDIEQVSRYISSVSREELEKLYKEVNG